MLGHQLGEEEYVLSVRSWSTQLHLIHVIMIHKASRCKRAKTHFVLSRFATAHEGRIVSLLEEMITRRSVSYAVEVGFELRCRRYRS